MMTASRYACTTQARYARRKRATHAALRALRYACATLRLRYATPALRYACATRAALRLHYATPALRYACATRAVLRYARCKSPVGLVGLGGLAMEVLGLDGFGRVRDGSLGGYMINIYKIQIQFL